LSESETSAGDRKPRKPISDLMRLTAFSIPPGARWDEECLTASMPPSWLACLRDEYHKRPGVKDHYSLPTRSLQEILIAVDPAVINAHRDPTSDTFVVAFDGVDPEVLTAGIAAWATTEIGGEVDWFELLHPDALSFTPRTFNLLEYQMRANGTAAPAPHVYQMLPSFLAKRAADAGLDLFGKHHDLILGPPQSDGRRAAVLWPPVKLQDERAGDGLATAKITFHLETVPNHPEPHIHADLSLSRFPLMPVTYVPSRGEGPPGATIWLHAPEGFLRRHEPHTLLAAPVRQRWARDGTREWRWTPGLARALAKLTYLPFPTPDKVFARPATAVDEGAIRAYILYAEGTKSQAADIDDPPDPPDIPRARSLVHAANTGFVPGDHIEVHRRLTTLLRPWGIAPVLDQQRVGSKASRKIKTLFDPEATYTIELWTQSPVTRDAVLAALEHHFGLTRIQDANNPRIVRFAGDLNLTVLLEDVQDLGAGILREPSEKKPDSTLLGSFANRVSNRIGMSPQPRAAIFELEGANYFARVGRVDPKPALKKAFARTDRRLQCLRPARTFTPPRSWPENAKRKPPAPYPGTNYGVGTIHRVAAAVNDALRQLGRLGAYETPDSLPDLEHIGIWLHHEGNTCVPIVVRLQPDGTATAHLARSGDEQPLTVAYRDLPRLLAQGKGRIGPGPKQKRILSHFLVNVLGIAPGVGQEIHDRIVFVRAGGFRNWGWDWLQDKHLRPDRLIIPGVEIEDGQELPEILTPDKCPGLRIARVRDRSARMEVARGFAADPDQYAERVSGLFRFSDRVFHSINPRSEQMQTPLSMTKLDPDLLSNLTAQVGNPAPVEICIAFKQPSDDPATLATLTSKLRRAHAHTEQSTIFPGVLHLCNLADEYI
jgi:pPIWI_RE module N-terminal domain/RNaseH domain of pPIWI_RE/MID domain of pPIWI_RE